MTSYYSKIVKVNKSFAIDFNILDRIKTIKNKNKPFNKENIYLSTTKDKFYELYQLQLSLRKYNISKWNKFTNNEFIGSYTVTYMKKHECIFNEYVNNAWVKLYEILYNEKLLVDLVIEINSFHICEIPGGFINALSHYIKYIHENAVHNWYAISIDPLSEYTEFDHFQYDIEFYLKTEKNWLHGYEGNGDITSLHNLMSCINEIKAKNLKFHIITADGSFNTFVNLIPQEIQVFSLKLHEFYFALHILCKNGIFIQKYFGFCTIGSLFLLALLHDNFKEVKITKPRHSKPGNSEVYVIAKGYKRMSKGDIEYIEKYILPTISKLSYNDIQVFISNIISFEDFSQEFLSTIYEITTETLSKQINVINKNVINYNNNISTITLSDKKDFSHQFLKELKIKPLLSNNLHQTHDDIELYIPKQYINNNTGTFEESENLKNQQLQYYENMKKLYSNPNERFIFLTRIGLREINTINMKYIKSVKRKYTNSNKFYIKLTSNELETIRLILNSNYEDTKHIFGQYILVGVNKNYYNCINSIYISHETLNELLILRTFVPSIMNSYSLFDCSLAKLYQDVNLNFFEIIFSLIQYLPQNENQNFYMSFSNSHCLVIGHDNNLVSIFELLSVNTIFLNIGSQILESNNSNTIILNNSRLNDFNQVKLELSKYSDINFIYINYTKYINRLVFETEIGSTVILLKCIYIILTTLNANGNALLILPLSLTIVSSNILLLLYMVFNKVMIHENFFMSSYQITYKVICQTYKKNNQNLTILQKIKELFKLTINYLCNKEQNNKFNVRIIRLLPSLTNYFQYCSQLTIFNTNIVKNVNYNIQLYLTKTIDLYEIDKRFKKQEDYYVDIITPTNEIKRHKTLQSIIDYMNAFIKHKLKQITHIFDAASTRNYNLVDFQEYVKILTDSKTLLFDKLSTINIDDFISYTIQQYENHTRMTLKEDDYSLYTHPEYKLWGFDMVENLDDTCRKVYHNTIVKNKSICIQTLTQNELLLNYNNHYKNVTNIITKIQKQNHINEN